MPNPPQFEEDPELVDLPALECARCNGVVSLGGSNFEKRRPSTVFCKCSRHRPKRRKRNNTL